MALLRRLSTATAICTLALVAIGGVVRATGAGDACPDWPRCFGSWIPPLRANTLIEYSHRLVAAVTVVLVLITAWVAWRRERRDPMVFRPILAAVLVVLVQAGLGGLVVTGDLAPMLVTLHFATAMALVALVMVAATAARVPAAPPDAADPVDPGFRRALRWTVGATGILLLVGAYVRGEGAGLAFLDWPLMDGRIVPDLAGRATIAAFAHRAVAAAAVGLGAVLAIRAARVSRPGLRWLARGAFGLLVLQAALGAAAVLTRLSAAAVAGHVTGSALAWAALVVLAAATLRLTPDARRRREEASRGKARVAAYLQLTKPDIILLLLITTVPAMVLAAGGMPPAPLVLATLAGGTLAAGGANAVNCYVDRDVDEVMARTRRRPIPSHRVSPGAALRFGVVLIAASFAWLAVTVNALAAWLTLGAAAFYVVVYTKLMKRATPQNIVVGGAAGAVPALVGWAAVTGTVGAPALVLFAIVFAWTPPHFWALAMRHAREYRAAGIPMLPAVVGRREAGLHILLYSVLLLAVSLLLAPVADLGALYVVAAVGLGALMVGAAWRVWRDEGRSAMSLFRFSITYLGLLFAAAAADQLLRA